MWRLTDPEETVYNAILAGYRRFDSACDYGNEEATGRGIARAIADGIVTRENLYITTKLWNTYHDPKHVPLALERCLKDLALDYVDEFLIHFPISMEVRIESLHYISHTTYRAFCLFFLTQSTYISMTPQYVPFEDKCESLYYYHYIGCVCMQLTLNINCYIS